MTAFRQFLLAFFVGLSVLAVLVIVALRPIPASSHEAVAGVVLREIYHAEKLYFQEWRCYASVEKLPDQNLYNPKTVKAIVDNGPVNGYFYESYFGAESWWVAAWPDIGSHTTAKTSFYIDQTGVVRHTRYVKEGDSRANATSLISHSYD